MRTMLDRPREPLHYLWAVCGVVVAAYVLLAALDAFDPDDVLELTIAVVALAALLLAHEWREQFHDER